MIIPGSPEMKSQLEAAFDLEISAAMFKETAKQYSHVDRVIPEAEWMKRAPYVHAINKLKKEVLFEGHEEARKLYDSGEYFNKKTLTK